MITNMCVADPLNEEKVCCPRARLLQARKPNAPVEWMQKLPQMARRLEESLFRSAQSFVSVFAHTSLSSLLYRTSTKIHKH